jgi:uncharacterized membrane protein
MYTGINHLHSFLRWVVLIVAIIAIIKALSGINGKKPFGPSDKKTGLFLMIFMDTMLLIGLYQYFFSDKWGWHNIKTLGFGEVMKIPTARFFAVEHFIGMIIAVLLVHLGYAATKKGIPDLSKHKKALTFYGLSLLIMIVSIPWPFRAAGAMRQWFPGMG